MYKDKFENEKVTNSSKPSETVSSIDEIQNSMTSKIKSGLLIGLSKYNEKDIDFNGMKRVPNDYRTLWIRQDKDKIISTEKKSEIITPYKDVFYKVGNSEFIMSKQRDGAKGNSKDILRKFSSYYNFSDITSHLADKPRENLFTQDIFKKEYLHEEEGYMGKYYKSQAEWLWYVGNKYACVMDYNYETSGGSYESGSDNFKIYEVDNLNNLNSRKKSVALADLLDESEKIKLQEYSQNRNKVISSDKNYKDERQTDIKNLLLYRENGKWQLSIPIYRVYKFNGNGSSGRYLNGYIDTNIKLPNTITSYDNLCIEWDYIKKKIPLAKDAVSSPNNDMLAVLTPTKLLVFVNPKKGIDEAILSIDVDKNESIILNQWATGEYVDKWSKLLSKY